MKHDIIDRDTGNIVGVISLSEGATSVSMILGELGLLHRLISELQDRLHVLEQELAEHTEHHC